MSLVGYPTRRQFQQQNIRAINVQRRELERVRVPVDPRQPNGRQRPLTQREIDLIIVRRTHELYSFREHSASAEPLYFAASPAQADRIMRQRFRVINLDQERWPDAEVVDRAILLQDLRGRQFYVFRVRYGWGQAAQETATRSEAPRDGWNEKIKRLEDLAANPRRVQRNLERYEREILQGAAGNNNRRRRRRP